MIKILVTMLFLWTSGFCFWLSGSLMKALYQKIQRCTVKTKATVVEIMQQHEYYDTVFRNRVCTEVLVSVFDYSTDGVSIRKSSLTNGGRNWFHENQKVTLWYNPIKTNEIFVWNINDVVCMMISFGLGVAFLAITLWMFR